MPVINAVFFIFMCCSMMLQIYKVSRMTTPASSNKNQK
jgi:hypothetical protein